MEANKQIEGAERPAWLKGKRVDEIEFCQEFVRESPLVCVHGSFYTMEGRVSDEGKLGRQIYEKLRPWVKSGVSGLVDRLLALLRRECWSEELPRYEDRILLADGTLWLDGGFTVGRCFCRNRLPVYYEPGGPAPVRWLAFLKELLWEEDIPTLQEYLGYCLLPTTRAQRMLMLVGKGGEGKSRIGAVLRAIFGDSMVVNSLGKIETNRFARADLEGALLMVDDDMQMEALPQTNYIKSIVTAEGPLDLEKKGVQSYQGELYVRFLGFGNGSLKALYDRSEGFFRRQIILTVRPKDPQRVDDPALSEKLIREKNGIFLWCFEGLQRLRANNYRFTVSRRARENLKSAFRDANNAAEFLRSKGYITLYAEGQSSSKELYRAYRLWCEDNVSHPLSARSFVGWLIDNQERFGLSYTNNIFLPDNRRVRGFLGVETVEREPWQSSSALVM